MINPLIGALTIITWMAVGFFMAGIFNIVLAFQWKGADSNFREKSRTGLTHS